MTFNARLFDKNVDDILAPRLLQLASSFRIFRANQTTYVRHDFRLTMCERIKWKQHSYMYATNGARNANDRPREREPC